MNQKKNIYMRNDIYRNNVDVILLPRDVFEIEGYSPDNIDDTVRIDNYVKNSMSELKEGESVELYINYGYTMALVSTLNVITQKNWTAILIFIITSPKIM